MVRQTRRTYRKRLSGAGRVNKRKKATKKKKTASKKKYRRRSPKESATEFKVGTVKTGLYGVKWVIVTYRKKNGKMIKKWQKL